MHSNSKKFLDVLQSAWRTLNDLCRKCPEGEVVALTMREKLKTEHETRVFARVRVNRALMNHIASQQTVRISARNNLKLDEFEVHTFIRDSISGYRILVKTTYPTYPHHLD